MTVRPSDELLDCTIELSCTVDVFKRNLGACHQNAAANAGVSAIFFQAIVGNGLSLSSRLARACISAAPISK
jgi:hypothetical protein